MPLLCYDAPCVTACPTSIDIPLFIRQIANGQPVAAAKTILETQTSWVQCAPASCPTENLSARAPASRRHRRLARSRSGASSVTRPRCRVRCRKTVLHRGQAHWQNRGGGGRWPAGLACAHALARNGHQVTIFEAKQKGGGLNEFGHRGLQAIDDIARRELDYILAVGGISVEYGKALGRDVNLADLKRQFDAVFLAWASVTPTISHRRRREWHRGCSRVHCAPAAGIGQVAIAGGAQVVVIGGGMTAIDAAVQAKLIGAEQVTIAYRRSQTKWALRPMSRKSRRPRGVLIRPNLRPVRIEKSGKAVTGVNLRIHDQP